MLEIVRAGVQGGRSVDTLLWKVYTAVVIWFEKKRKSLTRALTAVYRCLRDPEMPMLAKGVAFLTIAYAVSPIDLIPDWIPILGFLDDILLIPLGIALVIYLTPPHIYKRHLSDQTTFEIDPQLKKIGVLITIGSWVFFSLLILYLIIQR